ncbi:integrase [Pelomonas sp. Root662]|nr:integrase [Pelomonas sp. Root405]KRA77403.1 integrase [Pelomonas sp. Root662]
MAISQLEIAMDLIHSMHPLARAWLLDGPLSSYVEAFRALLERGRYAEGSSAAALRGWSHFAHWMTKCQLSAEQIDEALVGQFLDSHLPRCDCNLAALRTRSDLSASLGHLLALLREQHVIVELPGPSGPVAEELTRYNTHMRDARGLALGTREDRLACISLLLQCKVAGKAVAIGELQPEDVRGFIATELTRVSSASHASAVTAALRAYFRYRGTCGDAVNALLGAISSPVRWSQASLPRALTTEEVQRLEAHCTQAKRAPLRLLAMVRLALDLGLRVGEIAKLDISDFDWRAGTVTLKRTKSQRQDVLPLLAVTGQALAEYMRHERPATMLPSLFVRRVAPHDKPIGVDAVSQSIGRALRGAGISRSCHSLRHTLACRLVNSGSSIKEVADVLRHRSLDTSLIYAKLDLQLLAEVALPWPGSAS